MSNKLRIRALRLVVNANDDELGAMLWSFACFFCLLAGYSLLRPVRETMGLVGGVGKLPWLFTATFLVMLAAVPLFGMLVARLPRQRFVAIVYRFFWLNLLIFGALYSMDVDRAILAKVFYVWMSVYNLFVVSVFWSVLADYFRTDQAKRLYGFIAAGGTLGTIAGPWFTSALAERIDVTWFMLASALLLEIAAQCVARLARRPILLPAAAVVAVGQAPATEPAQQAERTTIGGSVFAGLVQVVKSPYLLGICVYVLFLSQAATFLYFLQADIVSKAVTGDGARTALFARIDLGVSILTVLLQLLGTPQLLRRLGVGWTLALMPLLTAFGFLGLAAVPVLVGLIVVQIGFRAGQHAIARPAREILFTVVSREDKYKAKNFIDTAAYRGGDFVTAWVFDGLRGLGLGVAGIAITGVPLAGAWLAVSRWLGRKQEALRERAAAPSTE